LDLSTNKLSHQLHAVLTDAEDLLKATAAQTGERVDKARVRVEESLRLARAGLQSAGSQLDDKVHQYPWTAVGVAAGLGLVLAMLLGRK
jgi:ElaB/YqjD/DUF883 family membrane-anchored ribosome-binding protein